MGHSVNVDDNFRLRCFKCGSYDTYICDEFGLGLTIYCDECSNSELIVIEEEEEDYYG